MANVAVTCIKNGRSDSFGRPLVSGTYYPSVEIETAKALWNSGYVSVADASVFDQDPLAGTSPLDDFNVARALSLSRQPAQTSANLAAELAALGMSQAAPQSVAGQQREVRGAQLWTPGNSLYDGGGGVGTGSIAISDMSDFSGWKVSVTAGTLNGKINVQKDTTGVSIAATDIIWARFFVPSWARGLEATLYISSVTNWTKFAYGGWGVNQLQEGWNELPLLASSMTASGGETFPLSSQIVRMQVKSTSGAGGDLYIGDIRVVTGVPMVTLCIDDCYSDLMRYAAPIFAKNGLSGAAFVVTGWQDQQESGAMSDNTVACWRDLQLLNDAGWDICSHATGHQNALSYSEVGTIASGETTATFSGVGTSGDNVINFTSGGELVFDKPRGLSVWASGNETGKACVISGYVGSTPTTETVQLRYASFTGSATEWSRISSVVISSASAGIITLRSAYNSDDYRSFVELSRDRLIAKGLPHAASWFAWPRGEFNKAIRDKLVASGFRIRGTVETQTGNSLGGTIYRDFPSFSAGGSRTLADLQTFVGIAQTRNAISSLFWHHVNPNPATLINTLPSVLITEIEWLAGQVYSGALRCPTFSQIEKSWLG